MFRLKAKINKAFRAVYYKLFSRVNGFLMIETMLYLFAISTMVCLMIRFCSSLTMLYRQHETRRRIAHVAQSIEQYALIYGSLPYPAMGLEGKESDPYQTPEEIIENPFKKNKGYIPYRTLGIDKRYAYDSNGRPLKYYVSSCMLKVLSIPSSPFFKRALQTKANSLLLAYADSNVEKYDLDFIGEKSYLNIDCGRYIIGVISKVPAVNIVDDQIFSKYMLTNIPAFAVTDEDVKDIEFYDEHTNIVKRTRNMVWISRFELGFKK